MMVQVSYNGIFIRREVEDAKVVWEECVTYLGDDLRAALKRHPGEWYTLVTQ
jgi:hypothetical protein